MRCLPDDVILNVNDFVNGGTDYINRVMLTMRYRIFFDNYLYLTEGVDWDRLQEGGFTLLNLAVDGTTEVRIEFY